MVDRMHLSANGPFKALCIRMFSLQSKLEKIPNANWFGPLRKRLIGEIQALRPLLRSFEMERIVGELSTLKLVES